MLKSGQEKSRKFTFPLLKKILVSPLGMSTPNACIICVSFIHLFSLCFPSLYRFLRELARLKVNSSSGDRELADWLKTLGHEYPQYMHNLIHCGIDLNLLPYVSDDHLSADAGITNGVHRMKILNAIRPLGEYLGIFWKGCCGGEDGAKISIYYPQ